MLKGRWRPTPAGVVACLAIALSLGGTAWAAKKISGSQIGKNTITSANLKNGKAVKGADVVPGSLGAAAVADGSLKGGAFTPGSVTGAKVNLGSLAVSRIFGGVGGPAGKSIVSGLTYVRIPQSTFIQPAGVDIQMAPSATVTFLSGCVQPRSASIYMLLDDPTFSPPNFIAIGAVNDVGSGTVTKSVQMGEFAGGGHPQRLAGQAAAQEHQVFVYAVPNCTSGSGITVDNVNSDLVGTG